MRHRVYKAICEAIREGRLITEPFTVADFKKACPGFREGTYRAFLYKHRKGNRRGYSELFKLIEPARFKLLRRANMV